MKNITYEELESKLNTIDKKDNYSYDDYEYGDYINEIESNVNNLFTIETKAILGIDIYQYSQYEKEKQNLIPFVFDIIYKEAIRHAKTFEEYIFCDCDFTGRFISTGDGGYIIFDKILHAFIFNLIFHEILRAFNSERLYPKLSHFIEKLTLRSCITYDSIFYYNSNWYGRGIINNARILSKDKLNRFLIDENTNKWFIVKFNGIEGITQINIKKIHTILSRENKPYKTIFFHNSSEGSIVGTQVFEPNKIKNVHIQKIGNVKAKNEEISVYNVEVQFTTSMNDETDPLKIDNFMITVGNLNTAGIQDT
jgi:hypothetical protein